MATEERGRLDVDRGDDQGDEQNKRPRGLFSRNMARECTILHKNLAVDIMDITEVR